MCRHGLLSCRNHWSLGQNCPSVCVTQAKRNASKTRGGNREGGRWEILRRGDGQMGIARLADLQVAGAFGSRCSIAAWPAAVVCRLPIALLPRDACTSRHRWLAGSFGLRCSIAACPAAVVCRLLIALLSRDACASRHRPGWLALLAYAARSQHGLRLWCAGC